LKLKIQDVRTGKSVQASLNNLILIFDDVSIIRLRSIFSTSNGKSRIYNYPITIDIFNKISKMKIQKISYEDIDTNSDYEIQMTNRVFMQQAKNLTDQIVQKWKVLGVELN
jgi:hypothetical protein